MAASPTLLRLPSCSHAQRATAEAEVTGLRAQAQEEVAQLRATAQHEVATLRAEAHEEVSQLRATTQAQAKQMMREAEARRAQIRAEVTGGRIVLAKSGSLLSALQRIMGHRWGPRPARRDDRGTGYAYLRLHAGNNVKMVRNGTG